YVRGIGQPHLLYIFLRHLGHKFVRHQITSVTVRVNTESIGPFSHRFSDNGEMPRRNIMKSRFVSPSL
ncbi:MAG: hypothetical protein K2G33_01095, partial [Duncaniella sp.]|nr:hypothetical protein [Duncaniella sp.]